MPPKPKIGKAANSQSTAVVRTGPKEVAVHPSRHVKKPAAEKPTTTRALVLRNGKHGAMGTGEVIHSTRITGREKLDLLAEDLIKKMQQAVMSPFKMEQALRISESQFGLYRDDIVNLKDPDLFRDLIEADITARTRPGVEPRRNATNLAKVIGTRIHNSYMLASAWKIVTDTLKSLEIAGLSDKNVKTKLKNDENIRTRYLVLFDMVNTLVDMSHAKLSVLATTAPHYSEFFKAKTDDASTEDPNIYFDWNNNKNLRTITQSFLDSIMIELCFPQAPFPRSVLYMLLKDCIDETPSEAKRFSQAMSNALGDLAFCIELQILLEAPLFGPEAEAWKNQPRQMPEQYEKWVDAQFFSATATGEIANWKDLLHPWAAARRKEVVDKMWKTINLEYIKAAGTDMDRLWQLDGALAVVPQWSSYWTERIAEDSDEEDDIGALFPAKKKKKPLAIRGPGDGNDSAGSMPSLQSVSHSSEDEEEEESSDDDSDYDSEYEVDDPYDTDEEDELRELMKEAMAAGHDCDWFDTAATAPELDPLKGDDRKGNPFLKALGSLRGRLFKSSPKIQVTTERAAPRPNARNIFRPTPKGMKEIPRTAPPKPTPAAAQPPKQGGGPQSHKTTMEEVEDEDAATPSAAKKKKKKKPKKKKAPGEGEGGEAPSSPQPTPQVPTSPTSPTRAQHAASASTLNIPIETTKAESGHAYKKQLEQSEAEKKAKIKTRGDHASIFSQSSQDTKKSGGSSGLFSKISKGLGKKDEAQADKNPKFTWFTRLSRKATESMHQLLKTSEDAGKQPAPMKWETFLKMMREMGFEYDPSTAGSSVRFDPPNPKDKPISIHKPHPDPTLTPIMLRQIGKRLQRYYGWNEEDFTEQIRKAA